ncbi:MAG: hypothetical protein C5B50_18375 [Verrucomicrobia bacterium]|nr:MAG: hypothetical protein C5B50_18375 [Verrucomicrobiota bacterium]
MNARTLIEAMNLWEASGSNIASAAKETSEVLAHNGIPNLVAGGIAVQLHGYARFTNDVDLVVADIEKAHSLLLSKGFRQSLLKALAVVHPMFKVTIDLLPGGKSLEVRSQVPFPVPRDATAILQPVTMEELIGLKLDSYVRATATRGQDKADVEKLIINNRLPRELPGIHPAMVDLYHQIWDAIAAETSVQPNPPQS